MRFSFSLPLQQLCCPSSSKHLPESIKTFVSSLWGQQVPQFTMSGPSIPGDAVEDLVVRNFISQAELSAYVKTRNKLRLVPVMTFVAFGFQVITLHMELLWPNHWAHAMFDGMYPAFVGASKLGLGTSPFHVVIRSMEEYRCNGSSIEAMSCFMEEAAERWGGLTSSGKQVRWILADKLTKKRADKDNKLTISTI
eukprot:4635499-Amphidinium_carterae.2